MCHFPNNPRHQFIDPDFEVSHESGKKYSEEVEKTIAKEFANENAERGRKGQPELTNGAVLVTAPNLPGESPARRMRCLTTDYASFVAARRHPDVDELRQQQVSVAGIVEPRGAIQEDPLMLVGLRSDNVLSHKNRLMTVPAGALEPKSTVERHTLKELKEEANIDEDAVRSFRPIALVTHNEGRTVEILSRIGTVLTPRRILQGHAEAKDKNEHQKFFFVRSGVLRDPERLKAFTDYVLRQVSSLDASKTCEIDLEQPMVPCLSPMAEAYRESLRAGKTMASQGPDWFCLEDAPDEADGAEEQAVALAA